VLRIDALPTRRGPPAEARTLYAELDGDDAEPAVSDPAGKC
jgi:hypothetical protein